MSSRHLTAEELRALAQLPEEDLVSLAVELDIAVPEHIDRAGLLDQCIDALLDVARRGSLPLSSYDREDLDALPEPHRAALARLMGTAPTADAMLSAGQKAYKRYPKAGRSQITLLVPTLLKPLARAAASS